MQVKNILITGATSGIGRETATAIAKTGNNIIFSARDKNKAQSTLNYLKSINNSIRIDYFIADLSSMQETRNFASDIKKSYSQIDVLINNAGLILGKRKITPDNYEYTFALDHLSPFLITGMLLDLLKNSPSARIITVSSAAHMIGRIHFNDIMLTKKYSSFKAYSQAKLANVLFTYELSRRLQGQKITSNALHPGTVASNFGNDLTIGYKYMIKLSKPFMIRPEKGAATSVHLALSPEVEGVSGKYFVKKKSVKSSPLSYDLNIAERLWALSEELTDFKYAI